MLTEGVRQAARPAALDDYAAAADGAAPLTFAAWAAGVLARWPLVAGVTLATLVAALLAVLLIPPSYEGTASFVPNEGGGLKLPTALSGAAGIAAELGVSTGSDPTESPAFYAQLIESRELLTRLVQSRFSDPRTPAPDSATLVELLDVDEDEPVRAVEKAIKRVSNALDVSFDVKTSLVSVSAQTEWPDLSAAVANRVVSLVSAFNLEQRQSRARARREFVAGRLAEARGDLAGAEERLRSFYERNRQYRASPTLLFEEGQLERQVNVANEMYLTLRRDFETARINEVNDAALITVVDSAVAPRRRQWPRYTLTFVTAAVLGLAFGLLAAGAATVAADWAARNPTDASRLRWAAVRAGTEVRASVEVRQRGPAVPPGSRL